MDDILVEDFLSHHGIRGQRWGIRNKRFGGDPVKQQRYSVVKNRHNLSDRQLNTYLDRLQRERALKTLTEDSINPGQRATKEMLGMVGKTAISAAIGTGAAYFVRKAFQAKFG